MMPLKIIECPRDAMQGFHSFVKTEDKVDYINALLKVGFYALDCGSFVSVKSVPHLADTALVLNKIDTLWDALDTPEQVQSQIDGQQRDTAEILGVPANQVVAVSAQKGAALAARYGPRPVAAMPGTNPGAMEAPACGAHPVIQPCQCSRVYGMPPTPASVRHG